MQLNIEEITDKKKKGLISKAILADLLNGLGCLKVQGSTLLILKISHL